MPLCTIGRSARGEDRVRLRQHSIPAFLNCSSLSSQTNPNQLAKHFPRKKSTCKRKGGKKNSTATRAERGRGELEGKNPLAEQSKDLSFLGRRSACKSVCRMSDVDEYRCFVGSLSWSTTEVGLKDAFGKFGHLTEAKVVLDKFSGRSRGFGFVTFDDKKAMEEAIEAMNGMDLDGRNITVERAQTQSSGRDRNGDRDYSHGGGDRDRYRGDYGRGRDRGQDFGGGRGGGNSGGGDCYKCGKPGHFARECPSGDGGRGDRYGGRDDRYGGSNESNRYGPDRGGDRYSGSRDGGSRNGGGGDRYNRDRSGPYERPSQGGYRS